jgi:hypothetical protein
MVKVNGPLQLRSASPLIGELDYVHGTNEPAAYLRSVTKTYRLPDVPSIPFDSRSVKSPSVSKTWTHQGLISPGLKKVMGMIDWFRTEVIGWARTLEVIFLMWWIVMAVLEAWKMKGTRENSKKRWNEDRKVEA